jgi:hypothetical protein
MAHWPRLIILLGLLALCIKAQTPVKLRCEWQNEPIAIQTQTPRFSWILSSSDNKRGIRQTAYRVIVSSSRQPIGKRLGDLWDSGKIDSSETLQITYPGKALTSSHAYYWAVEVWDQDGAAHWSDPNSFQTGLLQQSDWSALWIGAAQSPEREKSLPLFRREFQVNKRVSRAIVYFSGLGQYELRLNGEKLGKAVMAPGWTDYRKTVLYNSFDVTTALHKGDNVFGVSLGNGMYNVEEVKGRYTKFKGSFGEPKMLFQAQITFSDGTSQRMISDHNWHTVQGPTTFSSIYGGEDYDARLEQAGWDRPGFKEKEWLQAQETEGPGGKFVSQQSPPVEIAETFGTVKRTEPQPGVFVYDLGQNFSGWPQIAVKGPRGSSVKLIAGELLDRQGLASQRSTGGPQWFSYTLKGQGIETWHPSFSYWGFRYVQVELTPDAGTLPEVISLNGQFIHAAATRTGTFTSSSELLNKTHQLIDRAIESNLQSVLTDCPHREKLGWLEQTHLAGSALLFTFDLATLYEKIVNDMADAQQSDGLIPDIAPEVTVFEEGFRDSPEWGSAFILDPWLSYQAYGDTEILASHYEGMKKYADYLRGKAEKHIISYGLGDWYDIGPGEPGVSKLTSLGVTATAIYYQDLTTLAKCARVLHKEADGNAFDAQAQEVQLAFNQRFYRPDIHTYDQKSQTDYAMALVTGLVPQADRSAIVERLVADIRAHNNHVTAGDIGFHYVVKALMDNGRSDVLFDMLSRTDSPSYGYQLAKGATALTEAWDANPLDSQNHFMLGHAEEWFYRGLAGIDFDLSRDEEHRLIIRPSPVGDLTGVSASYDSVMGKITSAWTNIGGVFTLTVDIPANMTATIELPGPKPVTSQVVSGHYVFRTP